LSDANRRFQFQKRSPLRIGAHNETLSVAAVCIGNPDGSSLKIEGSKPSSSSYQ
jgi:hypothetical protein